MLSKVKFSGFFGRTRETKDYEKGGLRMVDFETMIKALRLAWISRLLQERQVNWKTVPVHFFSKLGGLNFLLTCNYDVKYCENLPRFYSRDILSFFSILKSLYEDETCKRDLILYNNKEILIGGKPFFNKEWFSKGIKSIRDFLTRKAPS